MLARWRPVLVGLEGLVRLPSRLRASLTRCKLAGTQSFPRERGGIGRRTRFRFWRGNSREGSTPSVRTRFSFGGSAAPPPAPQQDPRDTWGPTPSVRTTALVQGKRGRSPRAPHPDDAAPASSLFLRSRAPRRDLPVPGAFAVVDQATVGEVATGGVGDEGRHGRDSHELKLVVRRRRVGA